MAAEPEPQPVDETDMKWAANYIEEQQTKLILSLFTDNGSSSATNGDTFDDNDDGETKEDDYKSLRPSLEIMGIGRPPIYADVHL